MSSTSRWITLGAVAGGIVVLALATVLPVILAGSEAAPPPPPAVPACPASTAQLAGRHFTAESPPGQDLTCADLRDAVFDGLDLTQFTFRQADLRGASFRHAQLIQADLHGARLAGADLASSDLSQADLAGADLRSADLTLADLTQADLTGADLRGARLWLVGSIQAQVSDARVDIVAAGVVQLGYLSVIAALWRLIRWLVGLARRRTEPGTSRWRRRPQPLRTAIGIPLAVVYAGALYLMGRNMAALWAVDIIRPFLIAAGVLLITAVAQQLGPTTPVPQPEPSD